MKISDAVIHSEHEIIDGKIIASVDVEAMDSSAAINKANQEIMTLFSIINFFWSLVPYSHGRVYLAGDCVSSIKTAYVSDSNQPNNYAMESEIIGPVGLESIKRLYSYDIINKHGFRYIYYILNSNKSQITEQIIVSIKWADRAAAEEKLDLKLLFYTIALETIILIDNSSSELKYRLGIRLTHLLFKNKNARLEHLKKINKLYELRS